ncbi:MAG: family 78 glycoside hydrolase catalytic domain [Armatimonadetes bacterium]|nr:family 78 glycoside hydrolase catalytic domain [Armatimonadota bacterium]
MDWQAKWIWCKGEASPRNFYWCARNRFEVPDGFGAVSLNITADSRYSLWVNGNYVGHGPVRAFTHRWRYDTYDISRYVTACSNVAAVLVQHFGHSTFQYLEARGGLLAQIDCDCKVVAASDETWRGLPHPSYSRRTPRVSCQKAWVEHFDARLGPERWTEAGFDDSQWDAAVVVGEAGCDPWSELLPRDIPLLTQEPVYPVRVLRAQAVRPPRQVWSMDIKPNLLPGDLTASKRFLPGLLATTLHCSQTMTVSISRIGEKCRALRIDGKDVSLESAPDGIELTAGQHLLVADTMQEVHDFSAVIVFDYAEGYLELSAPLQGEAQHPFVTIGPLSSNEDTAYRQAWDATKPQEIAGHPAAQTIRTEHTVPDDVAALTSFARSLGHDVRIASKDAMLVDNEDETTISAGADVEVLLDFGKEVVGFIEIDLTTPEGVVIDFSGIENIQDGRIQWTSTGPHGLNNVFRYTTRQGRQSWRSVVRRGFRYATLTFRFPKGCSEPVRVRTIRCYLNTYPYAERGQFECNEALLNDAWEISRYTVRLCSEDTYVDCPAYEQTYWVGDARNESLYGYMAFGDYNLARRCLLLAGESLWRSPLVESQVPSGWQNILTAWSLLWVIACEEHYLFTGDPAFLEEVYPRIRHQNFNIRERFINARGLLDITAWNMLDWAPMDTPDSGIVSHQNMWCVEAFERSARIAEVLGRLDDAEQYRKWADSLRAAIDEHLWDERKQAYIDSIHADGERSRVFSQQTQAVAYLCNVVPVEKRGMFERYLTDVPEGWVRTGSPFMMSFAIEALAKAGDKGRILQLIRTWWGLMLEHNATTCWETFPDALGKDWHTRSYCHAWSAAPVFALPSYVLGVRPIEPGFKRFEVRPYLGDLERARGAVPTPQGEIHVDVHREDDTAVLTFVVPENTTAMVDGKAYPPGTHTRDRRDLTQQICSDCLLAAKKTKKHLTNTELHDINECGSIHLLFRIGALSIRKAWEVIVRNIT